MAKIKINNGNNGNGNGNNIGNSNSNDNSSNLRQVRILNPQNNQQRDIQQNGQPRILNGNTNNKINSRQQQEQEQQQYKRQEEIARKIAEENAERERIEAQQAKIERENAREKEKYNDINRMVEEELKRGMQEEQINLEIDEESLKSQNKKYKNMQIKKIIMYVSIILLLLGILIFGAYKTFFEHKYTGNEIAALANYYNGKTNFPESGVQGYITSNIDVLLKEKLGAGSGVESLGVSTPVITRINARTNNIANVYFYTTVSSNMGETKINAFLPIKWNAENKKYSPAGTVILTPIKSSDSNTNESKNELLSFEGIDKESDGNTKSSKTFLDNFFMMLYSGQDISPFYKGTTNLETSDLKYAGMSNYIFYKSKNKNGYNGVCDITLTMPNGVEYKTQKYISIHKSGESWIIDALL